MSANDCLQWGPLRLEDFVRYAGASGDFNPLHYDSAVAEAAGLQGPIAQGMLLAGLLASSLETWFETGSVRDLSIRFQRPAFVGDTLFARLTHHEGAAVTVTLFRGAEAVATGDAKVEIEI